jgi:predicted alpha/beta-fold hydrolase
MDRALAAATVREFDEALTVKMFAFRSTHAYYTQASSAAYVDGVAVPLLVLNAADDPISRADVRVPLLAAG